MSKYGQAYEDACAALYAREIGDAEYVARTRALWRKTARTIFRRWRRKLPAWVEPQDVEQELLLQALAHVRNWQPARTCGTIGQFVMWSAYKRTQRVLHHWRGALLSGNEGKNPSRAEKAFATAFGPDVDPMARAAPARATQDEAREESEAFGAALARAATVREAMALLALRRAEGSAQQAARLLYADYAARVECELRSERQALEMVGEAMRAVARRVLDAAVPQRVEEEADDEAPESGSRDPLWKRALRTRERESGRWIGDGEAHATEDRASAA